MGDCRDLLKELPECSVDSIVTDPPYELGFMGKSWDATGIAYDVNLWRECLRVLKPGGHILAFSGSRTYHRMAVAIEDAGFEIRDQIMWVYGSGFPKSLNVGKQEGCEVWDGWGTALKPAHEPIVLARKPLIGTVAQNVLTHGVGGLNIEASRIPSDDGFEKAWDRPIRTNIGAEGNAYISNGIQHEVDISANRPSGRWPANFIHDGSDEVLELFPKEKDSSAARFFYCAKASKTDRNEGLDHFTPQREADRPHDNLPGGDNLRNRTNTPRLNHHPTVKPTTLMRYLCRLITPPNGIILDPFTGSGSTGKAAMLEGFDFIGIEQSEEYMKIAEARIKFGYGSWS